MSKIFSTFFFCFILVVAILATTTFSQATATTTSYFTRFFASTPIPDQWLAHKPSGWTIPITSESLRWLALLPTWPIINKTINPSTTNQALPFIDEVSAVRILGGWQPGGAGNCNESCDIIDENLNFRWNLLDERVDPWVNSTQNYGAGKNILIVLDNVPSVFCQDTCFFAKFGQSAPPVESMMGQFHWFVKEIVIHFQQRYGNETVATRFRFRVGTEPDGPRYGNISQYFHSYIAASTAIKSVDPRIPVGAGNWLHMRPDEYAQNQWYEYQFYDMCHNHNIPVDFIAQSDYPGGGTYPGGRREPSFIKQGADAMTDYVNLLLYGKNTSSESPPPPPSVPREIHEFSPLHNREGRGSTEPGSFGVGFYIAMWTTALSNGLHKVFHWGQGLDCPCGPPGGGNFWTGHGWAMAMCDVLVGKPIVSISTPADLQRGFYVLSAGPNTDDDSNEVITKGSATIVTAYDPYRDATFSLSYTLPHDVAVAYMIDSSTSLYDEMLREATKLNYTQYNDGLSYEIKGLLNEEGLKWLKTPSVWSKFVGMQISSFTAKPMNKKKGDILQMEQFTTYLLLEDTI